MRVCHTLGPSVNAEPPLYPPTTYPPGRFCPPLDAHHSWSRYVSESAPPVSHTRVRSLGARIPQELFDYILRHVKPDVPTYRTMNKTERSLSPELDPISNEGLRSYTQVCRHWANKCRRYIFTGAVLVISSPEDMDEFIQYAFHGCPLLIPLHKIVDGVHILQSYSDTRSFCHRLPLLKLINVPIRMLELRAPPSSGLAPPILLKTPHWSIPPAVATPSSLLGSCGAITVKGLHMLSFSHVVQLVRHFSSVSMKPWDPKGIGRNDYVHVGGSIQYAGLTWENHCIHDSPVYRRPVLCRRPYIPNCVNIEAQLCTDNVRLCFYTAVARPTFAMHWMEEDERRWIFSLVMSFNQLVTGMRKCVLYSHLYDFEGACNSMYSIQVPRHS